VQIAIRKTNQAALHSIEQAASKDDHHAGFDTRTDVIPFLDAIVAHANTLSVFGALYKPYWIMCDAAALLAIVYAWAFSRRFPNVSVAVLVLAVLIALSVYKFVLEAKTALGKPAARSFLQDCLLIIIPCILAVTSLFKQPLGLASAFIGTLMPLYGCLARVGCFLGGCCYGKPSTHGVLYPRTIFESTDHGCRRYSPSPNPGIRVFPIQLVEAAVQATLFRVLATLVWLVPSAAASIFWLYLSLYAVIRFVLDFYRTTSARPRYWRLSEAQLTCLGVQAVSLTVLVAILRIPAEHLIVLRGIIEKVL
jgi:phosphatidylglycerol:prolipoprotein diacylglycerol transferase